MSSKGDALFHSLYPFDLNHFLEIGFVERTEESVCCIHLCFLTQSDDHEGLFFSIGNTPKSTRAKSGEYGNPSSAEQECKVLVSLDGKKIDDSLLFCLNAHFFVNTHTHILFTLLYMYAIDARLLVSGLKHAYESPLHVCVIETYPHVWLTFVSPRMSL